MSAGGGVPRACRRGGSGALPWVGAFELALCAHFVLARPSAVFACPEIKLGVFPPVLAALGPLRLGTGMAERLLLTGSDLSAERALQLGFVTELFDDDVEGAEAAKAWYEKELAPLSALALRQAVKVVRRPIVEQLAQPLQQAEEQYVGELLESADANEGIEAFIARRKPEWQDR